MARVGTVCATVSTRPRASLCSAGRQRREPQSLRCFLCHLERRRPRYPDPEASQGRVREVAARVGNQIAGALSIINALRSNLTSKLVLKYVRNQVDFKHRLVT